MRLPNSDGWWQIGRWAGLDGEWNPFSAGARAARAEEAGQISRALRLYAAAGQHDDALSLLESSFPSSWPVSAALIEAAEELFKLAESAPMAQAAGVPVGTADALVKEAREAAEAVWRCAERVEAVAAQEFMSERVEQALKQEAEKLERLIQATRQAREGLAELTLSSGADEDLDTAETTLRALGEAARELRHLI